MARVEKVVETELETQFAVLAKDAPSVAIKLLSGLGRELSKRLRRANQTIQQLEN